MFSANLDNVINIEPNICPKIFKDNQTLPISVSDVVAWQNQTSTVGIVQNDLITSLILTAREMVENYCWIDLTQTVYAAQYDICSYSFIGLFNNGIRFLLNRAPIFGMSNVQSLQYLDPTGVWNNFPFGTNLGIDGIDENITLRSEPLQWASAFVSQQIPFDMTRINAYKVMITFQTGYDDSTYANPIMNTPESIKTAMKIIVAWLYANRGDMVIIDKVDRQELPLGAKTLLDKYSIAAGTFSSGSKSGFFY